MFIGKLSAPGIWMNGPQSVLPCSMTSTRLPAWPAARPWPSRRRRSGSRLASVRRLDIAHADIDRLELAVVFDGGPGILATDARLLDAAEGRLDRSVVVGVDEAGARLQPRDHP